jgi:hypothetical protein
VAGRRTVKLISTVEGQENDAIVVLRSLCRKAQSHRTVSAEFNSEFGTPGVRCLPGTPYARLESGLGQALDQALGQSRESFPIVSGIGDTACWP